MKPAILVIAVIGIECSGNVYPLRTRHTVSATGAAYFYLLIKGLDHLFQQFLLLRPKIPHLGRGSGGKVIFHHFLGIHAGEHYTNLRLIPQPAECPLGRCIALGIFLHQFFGLIRQLIDQSSAPKRLHDHHGQTLFVGIL